MTAVEMAEQKGRARAMVLLVFAAASLLVLLLSFGERGTDFWRGLWLGITTAAVVNLLPLGRWLKPHSAVARLLEDEATRDHRNRSATAGFWAAITVGVVLSALVQEGAAVTPFDVARTIVTAAVFTALVGFAALELRAARD